MEGRGFIVHAALTSTLDGLGAEVIAAVLGAAYCRARGLPEMPLPKRFEDYAPFVTGIATESIKICNRQQVTRTQRAPAKSGAQRVAEYRARKAAEDAMCNDVTNVTNVTNVTKCNAHNEVSNKVSNKVSGALVTDVTPYELTIAADGLGIPADFALGYFAEEMAKLDWMARGSNGTMFKVTRANLASVLRGWWNQENSKKNPRASNGIEPAADLPTITEGDLIS